MAKPKNTLETATIKVSGNPLMEFYLDKATDTGFYGNNPTETAGILLGRTLEGLVKDGVIEKAPQGVVDASKKKP
jgi:hypothetical protein